MAIYRCAECGALNRADPAQVRAQCASCRRPLDTSGHPQAVDAAALVSAIRSSPAPVLVDFSTRGDALPGVEGMARAGAGRLVVLQVDPQREPAAVEAFSIAARHTLVLFRRGSEVVRRSDDGAAAEVQRWLEAEAAKAG
jgi:thioredoxin-like negative regulator of GroEL